MQHIATYLEIYLKDKAVLVNMKLYHNPRCSKSRQALKLLEGKEFEIVEYLKKVPSMKELNEICILCGIKPTELLRKKEDKYKELVKRYGEPNNKKALEWMSAQPKLIERPILINGDKGIVGRPPEKILEII